MSLTHKTFIFNIQFWSIIWIQRCCRVMSRCHVMMIIMLIMIIHPIILKYEYQMLKPVFPLFNPQSPDDDKI